MIPFVNIHTHKQTLAKNVVEIFNNMLHQENLIANNYNDNAAGIHPWYVTKQNYNSQLALLKKVLNEHHIIAIGECGLDRKCKSDWEIQLEVFSQQLTWAQDFKKPLIIHNVKAHNECLTLLKYQAGEQLVIMHGFNSNWNVAKQFIDIGCKLSFGSALLVKDSNAQQVLLNLNVSQFYLETDMNDVLIEDIYAAAAQLLKIELPALKELVFNNFSKDFSK